MSHILYMQPDWSGKVSTKYILGNLIDNGYFLFFFFLFFGTGYYSALLLSIFAVRIIFTEKKFLNYFKKILGLLNPSVADGAQHVLGLASAVAFFFFFSMSWKLPVFHRPLSDSFSDLAELKNRWPIPRRRPPPPRCGPASCRARSLPFLHPPLFHLSQKIRRRLTAGVV